MPDGKNRKNVDAVNQEQKQKLLEKLRCIWSVEANFNKGPSEMSTFFLNQGFPSSVVNRALNQVRPISGTSALTPSLPSRNCDRVPFILTYHPTSIHIQKTIRRHFHQLQRDATTRHIFPSLPLLRPLSYRLLLTPSLSLFSARKPTFSQPPPVLRKGHRTRNVNSDVFFTGAAGPAELFQQLWFLCQM
eukprot:g26444.t1